MCCESQLRIARLGDCGNPYFKNSSPTPSPLFQQNWDIINIFYYVLVGGRLKERNINFNKILKALIK